MSCKCKNEDGSNVLLCTGLCAGKDIYTMTDQQRISIFEDKFFSEMNKLMGEIQRMKIQIDECMNRHYAKGFEAGFLLHRELFD